MKKWEPQLPQLPLRVVLFSPFGGKRQKFSIYPNIKALSIQNNQSGLFGGKMLWSKMTKRKRTNTKLL